MSRPTLLILLSSYNGDRYIAEQINSIRRQTYTDWALVVRDDGSSDRTVAVVRSLAEQDPRISFLPDTRGNLGPAASFGALLVHAQERGAGYIALADQDDVWLPTKLARELDRLRDQEAASGLTVPLLIHSDLAVVREDLTLLHRSFLHYQGLRHQYDRQLAGLLIQNFVTGSTVMFNQALLECALPFPQVVVMHDWWLALCAAAFGQLLYLPEATVLYRQHADNAQGSQGRRAGVIRALQRPVSWWNDSSAMLTRTVDQARELEHRLERLGTARSSTHEMVSEFCSAFASGSPWERVRVVYRHGIRPRSFWPYPVPFFTRVLLWGGDHSREPAAASRPEPESQPEVRARP